MLFALIKDEVLISSKACTCITVPDNCGSLFSPMLGCKCLAVRRKTEVQPALSFYNDVFTYSYYFFQA